MRNIKKGSIPYWILLALEKSVDGAIRLNDLTNNPGYYAYWNGWEYPLKKSSLAQAIKRLRENQLVEQVKIGDEVVLKLVNSEDFILDNDDIEWDGKWRIVIFDIPEQKRIVRNLFRRNLKKWGFKYLQKSVWVSKQNVFDRLIKYVQNLGLEKYITIIETNKLSPKLHF